MGLELVERKDVPKAVQVVLSPTCTCRGREGRVVLSTSLLSLPNTSQSMGCWGWGSPACAPNPLRKYSRGDSPAVCPAQGRDTLLGLAGIWQGLEPLGTQNEPQLPMWDPGRVGGSGVWGPTALPCLQLLFL